MLGMELAWERLKNRPKDELCDIYWNIADNVWDRRIGRKPPNFDFLPDEPTRFKKRSKSRMLKPYLQEIERLTTERERRKYLVVVIQKLKSESEFNEWWLRLQKE